MHSTFPRGLATRVVPPLITIPWGVTIVMSRVWLGHHTWPQVFAGASYGIALGSIWFAIWMGGVNSIGKEWEVWVNGLIDAFRNT